MKEKTYDTCGHQKYSIRYHVIFSTKYRKKLLCCGMEDKIKEYMKAAESKQNAWKIEIMEIDREKPDHVHLLIKSSPSIAPYTIIHDLKQASTYFAWKFNHSWMSRFYWGREHHLWTRGYFCSSIGDACTKTIIRYIENQG